jgi:hypothetical protein
MIITNDLPQEIKDRDLLHLNNIHPILSILQQYYVTDYICIIGERDLMKMTNDLPQAGDKR